MRTVKDMAPPWFIDDAQIGASGKETIAICHSGDPDAAEPPIVCVVFRGYEDNRAIAEFICETVNAQGRA